MAILGFGKVGQKVWKTIQEQPLFKERFEVVALWNSSTKHQYHVYLCFDGCEFRI